MYLSDKRIKQLIDEGYLLDADKGRVQSVSYDLRTKEFYADGTRCDSYVLKPGNSIFVSSVESISLPANMTAQVYLRCSSMCKAILLDAPLYFPGHDTHLYFRLTNLSGSSIELDNKEDGYAQVAFQMVEGVVEQEYSGHFSDEKMIEAIGNYDVYDADQQRIKKFVKPIKKMERKIYGNVVALLTAFVGIFTLGSALTSINSAADYFQVCLCMCASVSLMVFLVGLIVRWDTEKSASFSSIVKSVPWLIPLFVSIFCFFAVYFLNESHGGGVLLSNDISHSSLWQVLNHGLHCIQIR